MKQQMVICLNIYLSTFAIFLLGTFEIFYHNMMIIYLIANNF